MAGAIMHCERWNYIIVNKGDPEEIKEAWVPPIGGMSHRHPVPE